MTAEARRGRERRAALAYLERGWLPVPLAPVRLNGCCACRRGSECAAAGKHPLVRWRDVEHVDDGMVDGWWARWPRAGVGLLTGARSGLLVVDVDPRHDGHASLTRLRDEHGPLPDTLVCETGGGGLHFYFAAPGLPVRNDAGRKLGAGLDVRGDGGLVVAPPTLHASGRRYGWQNWPATPAPAPAWLISLVRPRPAPVRRAPILPVLRGQDRRRRYGLAALRNECELVAAAVPGTRWATVSEAAYIVGTLVGAGVLDELEAEAALLAACPLAADFGEAEARAAIERSLRAGRANPRPLEAS